MGSRRRSSADGLNCTSIQLSKHFSSHEGYKLVGNAIHDECKLLQETKKLLEKRMLIDEQYAKNLQDLAATADRLPWPVNTHPIGSASREVFLQWSHLASTISSNAEQFRTSVMDDILKPLIEQKTDSKKFLDDEKRRYDNEHRKALNDLVDAEKTYLVESKTYNTKSMELSRLQSATKKDVSRIESLKKSVIEKRGNVYRAHNEYIIKLREYNFIDKQYVTKMRNLLIYHEEVQLILNRTWRNLLESIVDYGSCEWSDLENTRELLIATITSIDPHFCYDDLFKQNPNILPITYSPQAFNELLLKTSSLTKLKVNQFIGDPSTKQNIKQRIDKLTSNIHESIPIMTGIIKDKQLNYFARKIVFEQEQQIDYLQNKKLFDEELRHDFKRVLSDVGYIYNDDDDSDIDFDNNLTDRLEDQPYFHGVLPREQCNCYLTTKGDYLVRMNQDRKLVLSILWTDPDSSLQLKAAHYIIHEANQMYSIIDNSIGKPSVNELLSYCKRQKVELRNDGARLIRPVTKPNYMINNDEIHLSETILGKGNFGQVVRAEYRGKTVAVKVLLPSSADRPARERQNFINEALLLQQYKHKNIVKLIGVAAMCDPLMVVMELIEPGSLQKYLRDNDLRVPQLIQMCYDIAKGMAYLEKNNAIHRDLATRNCLLDKSGRVKVADFGLSRSLKSDEEYFSQIKEVPVRWWAVEVFSNSPYTNKSDVWSYGITAWEVFSKADTPYNHITHNHLVIDAVKQGERVKQPDKCPAKIYTIMTTCWLLSPTDRPSFERLVELLKKEKPLF